MKLKIAQITMRPSVELLPLITKMYEIFFFLLPLLRLASEVQTLKSVLGKSESMFISFDCQSVTEEWKGRVEGKSGIEEWERQKINGTESSEH